MVVVAVIMAMGMLVLEGLMRVGVCVSFGKVQEHAHAERDRPQCGADACSPVAEQPCQSRADEGTEREDRARACGTDAPLREKIELKAQAVTSRSADEEK